MSSSPPSAVPLPLPPPATSRRLPPPCWSPEETAALIDAYRDKWYSLGRTNLKATHWQDVADAVFAACPTVSPPKTAVQCRHKMEKLRKRYRAEIQRARSIPVAKFNSSWVHFRLMDSMEKGPSPLKSDNIHDSPDEAEDKDEDQDKYNRSYHNKFGRNGIDGSGGFGSDGGFRIRIPSGVSIAKHGKEESGFGKRERERERDGVEEMASAIKVLGDGYVRVEKMKMEMAREIENMRMEMEMKRTQMILESQQRIVEAFAKAVSEQKKNKKKAKKMSSPSQS